ncbi:MAG: hypothetical protein EZS28_041030 [Streblomastix strix]|uniref:C2 domain-containing protein n=1 Tax=Streblomastix strix TaxID=222440 RepID=A0A5J4TZM4_9EUKA|nr:MAG: hypothetical protein EZS28_041030 [Streblomastix strix]
MKYEEEKRQFADKQELERNKKVADDGKNINGVVILSKIGVRKLPKMDVIGKIDPYVVFALGDSTKQTTVAKETHDYDYLNETYEIIYDPLKMQGNREMNVSVYDYDSVGSNDLIGSVNVDV